MPEPLSFTVDAIRARWQVIAELPINSNLDLARIGEQALMDVPALLAILAERPPLGYVAVYIEDGRPVRVIEKGTVFADRDTAEFYANEDSTLAPLELREVQP